MTTQSKTTNRYEHRTCPKCDRQWQIIDWRCAAHHVSCGPNIPDLPAPQSKTTHTPGWNK